ncbi:MAG: hypothetical protein ACXWDI_08290 [Nocardioides sp.]
MRGLLAATAVVGVLAIGGLPTLALSLADDETGSDRSPAASQREPGPPPWAHGKARGHEKPGQDDRADKDKQKDKAGAPGWMRHDGQVPPGWARNHTGRTPHGWAMRAWAHCVADAAAGLAQGEKLDPESACGERPEPPKGDRR